MSEDIYDDVMGTETLDRGERVEMMVNIYESLDSEGNHEREQELQHTDWHSEKWIYYNFSFYFISSEYKSWSDSREYCKQRRADLMIINNKEEQEFMQKFTKKYDHNYYYYYWIGLRKEKGGWKWVDETKLTTRHWMNGYPNTYTGNCAQTCTSGWDDYSCNSSSRWICEKRV